MAPKSKGRGKGTPYGQPSSAFVPAAHTHNGKHGPRGMSSMDFNASPSGYGESVHQYSRDLADYSQRRHGMTPGKKRLVVILCIVLAIALVALGVFVFKEFQKNAINQDLHSMSEEEMQAVDNELTGSITFEEPFTMLLLGSDARADDPDMGARTDTIILTRIDPLTNNISMVSIPRDTMIQIPGHGTQKFNAAYTFGGASGTIAAVKELCGVDIDHYAEVNFESLVGLIDAIGGVDVMVEETVDDPDAGNIVIPAGQQHLDGESALVFSRSRAYADGDYTRVSNQRKVIEAIVHKGLEAPATDLHGLIQSSAEFLTTDKGMDVDFIYSLADQIRHNNDYPVTIHTTTLPSSTSMIDGISYVIADKAAVAELMKVFSEGGDVSLPLSSSSIADDAAAAGAVEGAGSIDDSYNYYYEEPTYSSQNQYYYYDPYAGTGTGTGAGAGTGYDSGYGTGAGTGAGAGTGTDAGASTGTGTDSGYGTGGGTGYDSGSGTGGTTGSAGTGTTTGSGAGAGL